jgi:hypothetical protein
VEEGGLSKSLAPFSQIRESRRDCSVHRSDAVLRPQIPDLGQAEPEIPVLH